MWSFFWNTLYVRCNFLPSPNLAQFWIPREVENLERFSLQDEATDFFVCVTLPQLNYQSSSSCIFECGTPSWACSFSSLDNSISCYQNQFWISIKKSTFIFFIFGLQAEILTFCAFCQFTYPAKIACQKNVCLLKLALSFLK